MMIGKIKDLDNTGNPLKWFFLILFPFILWSCGEPKPEPPKQLIPQEKMTEVFVDLILLETRVESLKFKEDTAFQIYQEMEQEIWKKHGIDSALFKENHRYYLENMKDYESVFKTLIDSFGVMESRLESEQHGNKNTKIPKKEK